jgi:hypothetical protein
LFSRRQLHEVDSSSYNLGYMKRSAHITTHFAAAVLFFFSQSVVIGADKAVDKHGHELQDLSKNKRADVEKKVFLDIRPAKTGWGKANVLTVQKVLHSAAAPLWQHFPGREVKPIVVRAKGGPIVLFRRGSQGEYFVHLNTGGLLWAQYSFQFSHEFCHILCGYDQDKTGNKWFEETLCELASLYSLRVMGQTWKTKPPFGHWKNYAKHLTSYAQQRIDAHPLPDGQSLAEFFEKQSAELYRNATNRKLNNIVAVQLLPLIEKEPKHWEAVTWLNAGKPAKPQTFKAFLKDWHDNCPQRHKGFVKEVAKMFEIKL